MLNFRRLPPFLRIVNALGLLFVITALIMWAALFIANPLSSLLEPPNDSRVIIISVNLVLLSAACSGVVNTYAKRVRQPDAEPFPLDSWQRQALAIALMGALPLCAIILAALISPAGFLFGLVFALSVLAVVVFLGVSLARSATSPTQRPR